MQQFKMIIRTRPHPRKITHEGKQKTVIVFDCTHPEIKVPGKRKDYVQMKLTVYSLAAWSMFKDNNLYVGKYLYIKGNTAPTLGETAFWATDIEEVTFTLPQQDLFNFEEHEF